MFIFQTMPLYGTFDSFLGSSLACKEKAIGFVMNESKTLLCNQKILLIEWQMLQTFQPKEPSGLVSSKISKKTSWMYTHSLGKWFGQLYLWIRTLLSVHGKGNQHKLK